MFRDMRPRSRALIAATTLGLIAAPLTFTQTAQANPGGTGLVISEVYGGGGNTGATWSNDFIEIHNPTAARESLARSISLSQDAIKKLENAIVALKK